MTTRCTTTQIHEAYWTSTELFVFILREIRAARLCLFSDPRSLLQLVLTCRTLYAYTEKTLVSHNTANGRLHGFWYSVCLTAYPDSVIAHICAVCITAYADECDGLMDSRLARNFMQVHMPIGVALANTKNKCIAASIAHHSFTAQPLLEQCSVDLNEARHAARLFRLLFPLGVPPAAYFFVSHHHLRLLTLEFSLLQGLFMHICECVSDHMIRVYPLSAYRLREKISITSCEAVHRQQIDVTGYDSLPIPVLTEIQWNKNEAFDLVELAGMIRRETSAMRDWSRPTQASDDDDSDGNENEHANEIMLNYLDEAAPLYDRVVKAALRYDVSECLVIADFPSLYDPGLPVTLLPDTCVVHGANIFTQRDMDASAFGHRDPLLIDVLAVCGREEDAISHKVYDEQWWKRFVLGYNV